MKNFTKVTILLICFCCSYSFAQKKYSLIGKNITQLNITYDNTITPAPGYRIPLGITAVSDKKKGFTTKGMLEGKTRWDDFTIVVDGGKFEKGEVIIFRDPRQIKNHTVTISASPKDNDNIKQSISIKVSYDVDVIAEFSGADSRPGRNGKNGRPGSDGHDSSSGDGGSATKAGDGEMGEDGKSGGNGFNVAVYATIINDPMFSDPLLKIKIKNLDNGLSYYYLVNAVKNSFMINTDGGDAGDGGDGGSGGNGGNGGNGAFVNNGSGSILGRGGDGSNGGDGGDGGNGGEGGSAGSITVELDPSVKQFSKAITFSYKGGNPGKAGKKGIGNYGKSGTGGAGSGRQGKKGMEGIQGGEGSPGDAAAEPLIKFGVIDFDW